jgi:D-sedoheptulose 7-phosphate isomerase
MREVFERGLGEAEGLLRAFRADGRNAEFLSRLGDILLSTFKAGNKVMICGNGGSMADAMHFAEEWTGRFRADRQPYPAIALGADPTHLTCVGNDYGFEHIFSRQVQALGKPGDMLILLSTSGNSPNLTRAAEAAKAGRVLTVGFLGRGGGALKSMCDHCLIAPGETSDRIQELHMLCLHLLIEAVEGELERVSFEV